MIITIFELQLLFVLFLHLVEQAVYLLLVLTREHLELRVILVVHLLYLLVEDILVVAYLDHVLLDLSSELVDLLLEFFDDVTLLANDQLLFISLVIEFYYLRLQILDARCHVGLQRLQLPLLVL